MLQNKPEKTREGIGRDPSAAMKAKPQTQTRRKEERCREQEREQQGQHLCAFVNPVCTIYSKTRHTNLQGTKQGTNTPRTNPQGTKQGTGMELRMQQPYSMWRMWQPYSMWQTCQQALQLALHVPGAAAGRLAGLGQAISCADGWSAATLGAGLRPLWPQAWRLFGPMSEYAPLRPNVRLSDH